MWGVKPINLPDARLRVNGRQTGVTVELDGREHALGPGDSISYESARPHRLRNDGAGRVRAVWLNFTR